MKICMLEIHERKSINDVPASCLDDGDRLRMAVLIDVEKWPLIMPNKRNLALDCIEMQ